MNVKGILIMIMKTTTISILVWYNNLMTKEWEHVRDVGTICVFCMSFSSS